MNEQYSIGNKFDLVKELSFEPFGCYYRALSLDGEEALLLLLNSEVSDLARCMLPELLNSLNEASHNKKDKNPVLVPVIDIIDFIEGIAIVMPYIKGMTLAQCLIKGRPQKIPAIKDMLQPALKALDNLHVSKKFYGFLNFSTAWLADNNRLHIIGYGLFDKLFADLDILNDNTELRNPRIVSCIKSNPQDNKIKGSVYADYYAVYMFVACLLQGHIAENGQVNAKAITRNLNTKSKIYLTPTFCAKFCKEGVTLTQWMARLQAPAVVYTLYPLASLAALTCTGMILYNGYQLWQQHTTRTVEVADNTQVKQTENLAETNAEQIIREDNSNNTYSKVIIENEHSTNLYTADQVVKDILGFDMSEYIELALNSAKNPEAPEETQDNAQDNTQNNDELKCNDASCYDLISAGIKGPELAYVELDDKTSLIMKNPITRKDYYIYCYMEKTCSLKSEFDEAVLTKCLFSKECSGNLSAWLKQPMEFISSFQISKYVNWLNTVTSSKYDIISDKDWITLAARVTPGKKCRNNKDGDFITYDGHPEWVKMNNTIAFRGPIKSTKDGYQCEIGLQLGDADKYLGKVFVRLVKTA